MKITSIKQQAKNTQRYSVYLDGKYSFSLSESALIESKIHNGQELSAKDAGEFKKLSVDDKLKNRALRYASARLKTAWEVEFYLQQKGASPALSESILNTLSNLGIVNDLEYAKMFIRDRTTLRAASKRKIQFDLRKKRIDPKVIDRAFREEDSQDDATAILEVIAKKRRQSKYQDDIKLAQYLARQGFRYDDIKGALRSREL